MATATYSSFTPRAMDVRRANRAISWSIAIHAIAVATLFLLPRDWFAKKAPTTVMTISLGGTPGPKTTGTTSIGGRTVEQVTPPPKRPEPAPPAPEAKPVPMPPPTPPRLTETRPTSTPKPPPMPPVRAPVAGRQIAQGNTSVDTGARGQGAGLTFGGGGLGGETDLKDFCCPEYLNEVLTTIGVHWQKNPTESGVTILKFVIRRDGGIDLGNVVVERASGVGILDRLSRAALIDARLPPLPPQYTNNTLTIHLCFPQGNATCGP
jgi:outer membrane biosynthesis protein TonB